METYPNEIDTLEAAYIPPRLRALLTEPTVFDQDYVSPRTIRHGVEIPVTLSGLY